MNQSKITEINNYLFTSNFKKEQELKNKLQEEQFSLTTKHNN